MSSQQSPSYKALDNKFIHRAIHKPEHVIIDSIQYDCQSIEGPSNRLSIPSAGHVVFADQLFAPYPSLPSLSPGHTISSLNARESHERSRMKGSEVDILVVPALPFLTVWWAEHQIDLTDSKISYTRRIWYIIYRSLLARGSPLAKIILFLCIA